MDITENTLANVQLDHTYSFPSTLEAAKVKCDKLQDLLDQKLAKENKQRKQIREAEKRAVQASDKLGNALEQLKDQKLISSQKKK